jgi:hypothetical protein
LASSIISSRVMNTLWMASLAAVSQAAGNLACAAVQLFSSFSALHVYCSCSIVPINLSIDYSIFHKDCNNRGSLALCSVLVFPDCGIAVLSSLCCCTAASAVWGRGLGEAGQTAPSLLRTCCPPSERWAGSAQCPPPACR